MISKVRRLVTSFVVFGLVGAGTVAIQSPASAVAYDPAVGDPVGLIVKYDRGVDTTAEIAETLAVSKQVISDLAITYKKKMGLRWYTFKFNQLLTKDAAQSVADAVANQVGVAAVEVDEIIPLSAASLPAKPQTVNIASGFRAVTVASAVKLPFASNACVGACGFTTGSVNLSWTRPATYGSYPLYGYRIAMSSNGTTFSTKVSNTGKVTSYTITGLTAGKRYYFKIAALTKSGTITKVGSYSPVTSAVPTTKPAAPVLASARKIYKGDLDPAWYLQSKAERGGSGWVEYVVTAAATGQTSATCSVYNFEAKPYTCSLDSQLVDGVAYNVTMTAENLAGLTNGAALGAISDPYYADADYAWHFKSRFGINAPGAWAKTKGAAEVTIAVIDSGLTYIPELKDQYYKNSNGTFYGYDFVSNAGSAGDLNGWDSNPLDESTTNGVWHGTEVAAIALAKANSVDTLGVAPTARLLPVRALGDDGATLSDVPQAILWAAGFKTNSSTVPQNLYPAQVINLSLQTSTAVACDEFTQDVITAVANAGSTVVVAAGNNGEIAMEASDSYPASCLNTVIVGSSTYENGRAYYSNRGPGVDISAPSGGTNKDADAANEYIWFSTNSGTTTPVNDITSGKTDVVGGQGTSYSAPIVSGVVALMYSVNPEITFFEVLNILQATAQPFRPLANPDLLSRNDCTDLLGADTCGAGIVDAGRAVAAAARLK